MRIEVEMGAALTVGALRDFVGQVERSGGGPAAYVTFSKRRSDGVVVACADFEPAPTIRLGMRMPIGFENEAPSA